MLKEIVIPMFCLPSGILDGDKVRDEMLAYNTAAAAIEAFMPTFNRQLNAAQDAARRGELVELPKEDAGIYERALALLRTRHDIAVRATSALLKARLAVQTAAAARRDGVMAPLLKLGFTEEHARYCTRFDSAGWEIAGRLGALDNAIQAAHPTHGRHANLERELVGLINAQRLQAMGA